MKLSTEPLRGARHLALLAVAAAFAMLAVPAIAARAQAAETIYWENFGAKPSASIGFANVDGSGGGELNLSGLELEYPEGLAFDPANGRLYVADAGVYRILWVALDGSGVGVLDTGAAPVQNPEGITLDTRTQTVYWANHVEEGSIGYAHVGGGDGGTLNTAGANLEFPNDVVVDTVSNRVYWSVGWHGEGGIFYAGLDGSGGGRLNVADAALPTYVTGLNVDPAAGRLYVLGDSEAVTDTVFWLNLSGVGGGEVDTSGAPVEEPYGLAFDPSLDRFYWGNYNVESTVRAGALGTATLAAGGGAGIDIATAPVAGPQDPVVLKSPTGTDPPRVTRQGAILACSQGGWSQDYPGSYVYGAPVSYAYQWLSGGREIAGATASTYAPPTSGSYACRVTGTNQSGAASQTSAAAAVTIVHPGPVAVAPTPPRPTPAKLLLKPATKKPVKAKAGRVATVKLRLTNAGGTASAAVKVCGTLTKRAKKGLRVPSCAAVASVAAGKARVVKLRVKAKKSAKGTYKLAVKVKGARANSVTARVRVVKPHRGKRNQQPKRGKRHRR